MNTKAILLVAYQCAPNTDIASQQSWDWYCQLCEKAPVSLITDIHNQNALIAAGAPLLNSQIYYIDTTWLRQFHPNVSQKLPASEHSIFIHNALDYLLFDWLAYRQLKAELKHGTTWQSLHRTQPQNLSAPSWLSKLSLPFTIGAEQE